MKQNLNDLKNSFDSISKIYDEKTNTFLHEISFYLTIENMLQELPENRSIKILDSGGGTGKYSLYFSKLECDVQLLMQVL